MAFHTGKFPISAWICKTLTQYSARMGEGLARTDASNVPEES
jgi:hypothetical protein